MGRTSFMAPALADALTSCCRVVFAFLVGKQWEVESWATVHARQLLCNTLLNIAIARKTFHAN